MRGDRSVHSHCPVLMEGGHIYSKRSKVHAIVSSLRPRFPSRAARRTGSHSHDVAIIVRPLPRDRRPLLVHLEAIPLALSAQRLVSEVKGNGFLIHACRGRVSGRRVACGAQGDARWLVQEADNEHFVVHVRGIIWEPERFVDAVRQGGLRAVEHEDVFVALVYRDAGLPGVESFGEQLGHFQERAVIVGTPIRKVVPALRGRVRGANVRTLAPVVPGHDLNEVRLRLKKVQPFLDEDPVVLLVGPIHIRAEALEEPGRDRRHPFPARGGASAGVFRVKIRVVGGGQASVNPGEDAVSEGLDGRVGLLGIFGHSAGDEQRGRDELRQYSSMPVPGWRASLESAEHGLVVDDELAVVRVVEVD